MECKYAIRILGFPYRLCKLQRSAPVGCNIIQRYEDCQILKEYNIDTSAQHPTSEGDDIVRAYTKDKYKNQEIKNS
jgi:hypothetical protein